MIRNPFLTDLIASLRKAVSAVSSELQMTVQIGALTTN